MAMEDLAWELARVIVHDETRATTIVAALAESHPVTQSTPPLSRYAAEIRRDWRPRGLEVDPADLESAVTEIFDGLGKAVRAAVARGDWDWGDHPPTSFASWLGRQLDELQFGQHEGVNR
jgi:hypothetical protein